MIAVIQGCGSNINSIQFALNRLNVESILTSDPTVIRKASHVILPGVGHASHAMNNLRSLGLVDVIKTVIQPILGICLGMQLLYDYSEEGHTDCLGMIPGTVVQLKPKPLQAIPHMGWNTVCFTEPEHALSKAITPGAYAYFVHSYAAPVAQFTVASTEYTELYTAIVQRDNVVGMQFHPERSGTVGEQLLINFLEAKNQ